ncbi:MAG: glycerol-3-phosphate dehydrogenase C-terminal domain-containing protein [Solirubrobacterales bacterium]
MPTRLVRRYGAEAGDVVALGARRPELRKPLADGLDVTGAELVFALRRELAITVDDLLDRRTRLGLVPARRAAALAAARELVEAVPVAGGAAA